MTYKRDQEEPEKVSDWKGCCANTCPIQPSVSTGGNQYCTFHAGSEYADFDSITKAVRNNLQHYLYYRKVIMWGTEQWKHNLNNLRNYEVCKILHNEEGLPCIYEQRLFNSIRRKVSMESKHL